MYSNVLQIRKSKKKKIVQNMKLALKFVANNIYLLDELKM